MVSVWELLILLMSRFPSHVAVANRTNATETIFTIPPSN
jgi:hypothetical protein